MSSEASPVAPLALKPDLAEAQRRWLAFWEHEIIDRPCCAIRAPRDGAPRVAAPKYMAGAQEDLEPVAQQALAWAETVWWGGESIPCYSPSFGPDLFAAWLGAELKFAQDERTSWAVACVDDWERALPLRIEPDNYWWRRMLGFCRILADTFAGKLAVAHLDIHSNLDALLALRGGVGLCLDLMDAPELIDRAMRDVRACFAPAYEGIAEAARMGATGVCGRIPAYHPVRTNTIQCDFAALIGPAHFRRWAMPALEEEAASLGHCLMHYDGPQMLVHLNDVLTIPGIDCIQWQPGAGNKPFIQWIDLLKEIQSQGVAVYVSCNTEELRYYHRELKPNLVFYQCGARSRQDAEDTLKWLAANT